MGHSKEAYFINTLKEKRKKKNDKQQEAYLLLFLGLSDKHDKAHTRMWHQMTKMMMMKSDDKWKETNK